MKWSYKGKEVNERADMPEGALGFIYEITADNGKKYIGRKILISKRKRKFGKRESSKITDKRKKLYEIVIKESDWKTYTGSNKDLNEDIKNGLNIKREILQYAFNKKQLGYLETKQLFVKEVLENPEYYNSNILGKFYPKDVLND